MSDLQPKKKINPDEDEEDDEYQEEYQDTSVQQQNNSDNNGSGSNVDINELIEAIKSLDEQMQEMRYDVQGVQQEQNRIAANVQSHEQRINQIKAGRQSVEKEKMDLIRMNMNNLAKEIDEVRGRLEQVGSLDKQRELDELVRYRGIEEAYYTAREYIQLDGRDAKIIDSSLVNIKNLMHHVQEGLIKVVQESGE